MRLWHAEFSASAAASHGHFKVNIKIVRQPFLFVLPDDLAQARLLVDQAVHLYNEAHPGPELFNP